MVHRFVRTTDGGRSMRHRRTLLAGVVACATALAASAAASAESVTYTTPGLTTVALPAGVGSVHAVAVGGRGGGIQGGYGAVVTADFDLNISGGLANQIRVFVGGNGAVGVAGDNGGGGTPFPSLAGGGGGWSAVSPCVSMVDGVCNVFARALVAGGGGGGGADGLPGTGGAGGSAGTPGGSGSTTALLAPAGGGSVGVGGSGGLSSDLDCNDGDPGEPPTTGLDTAGGAGGASFSLDGHGDGGGGGGGNPDGSGGGGGAGAWCVDDTGMSGGGGGGGDSAIPTGGQLEIDTTGSPHVTLSWTDPTPAPPPPPPTGRIRTPALAPIVTIQTPADGAEYAQHEVVRASFSCSPASTQPGSAVRLCSGTVRSGRPIATSDLGDHTFTVTASSRLGGSGVAHTVHYTVVPDRKPPSVTALTIAPRTLVAEHPREFARVRFSLDEPAQVTLAIRRIGARRRRASAARAITLIGHTGMNGFRLRVRNGVWSLRPGRYLVTLVAMDSEGNRSTPTRGRFRVVDSDR